MNIFCVDDNPYQLKQAVDLITLACEKNNCTDYTITECANGAEFLKKAQGVAPNLVLLDINMPILDGLSTLVRLRAIHGAVPVVMVSSENAILIRRFGTAEARDTDDITKQKLLSKVVDRVKAGKSEQGKINSVLEACGKLGLDPVKSAIKLGANEYICKPYQLSDASKIIEKYVFA